LGTDFGTAVEVLSGIGSGDHLIVNPADALSDGDVVTLVPQSQPQPQRAKAS
jgi:molybdopterin converting factor small subunit